MNEVEVNLRVPPSGLPGLRRALARGLCRRTKLHAWYFDTADARLAAAGWALRLRREGAQWVQTLKGPGGGGLTRREEEVPRGRGRGRERPPLDLEALAAGAAGRELLAALEGAELQPVFEVAVTRTHRVARHGTAHIELALDEGVIRSGERSVPVCELELELQAGGVAALAELASRWSGRHGLWLDLRTKSERGYRLQHGDALPVPARAAAAPLTDDMSASEAARHAVGAALPALLDAAAKLAGGEGDAETLHQARVGLRRVISLLRVFAADVPAIDAAWIDAARTLFRQLGAARDRDVLQAWLLPALREAGGPALVLPAASDGASVAADPGAVCRSAAMTDWLLTLLAFTEVEALPSAPEGGPAHEAAVLPRVAPRLLALHRRLRRAGARFAKLADEERHRHRKQLKRLRYAAEALSLLFPKRAWARYAERLKAAQEKLGHFNDVCIAQDVVARLPPTDAAAAFALGWLAANKPKVAMEAGRALRRLRRAPNFLR